METNCRSPTRSSPAPASSRIPRSLLVPSSCCPSRPRLGPPCSMPHSPYPNGVPFSVRPQTNVALPLGFLRSVVRTAVAHASPHSTAFTSRLAFADCATPGTASQDELKGSPTQRHWHPRSSESETQPTANPTTCLAAPMTSCILHFS